VSVEPAAGEELVEVVDIEDRVIEVVTRQRMRAENLRHRSVAVVVFDSRGRLLIHRRADHKDVWPGHWDLCFGGVVAVGEAYATAAVRELAEEAGIDGVTPEEFASGRYDDADVRTIVRAYRVVHDGPYVPVDGEVVELRLVDPDELGALAATAPFVPDSWTMVLPLLGPFATP